MPRKNIGTTFIPPLNQNNLNTMGRNQEENLSQTQTSNILTKTNQSRDFKAEADARRKRQDSNSPEAEKRNQSFNQVSSNFDRLYNKRIDFDRIVAGQMSLADKEDYLEKQMRLKVERTALPPPD